MASTEAPIDGRELRREYRNLQTEAKRKKEELASLQTTELQNLVRKADKLHKNAEKPKEHALDAELFQVLSEAGLEATKKLDVTGSGQGIAEFVRVLRWRYVQSDDQDVQVEDNPAALSWHDLDTAAELVFQPSPGVNCMLGPMDAHAKVRKVPQQRAKRQTAALVRPDEVEGLPQEGDKQETDQNMEEMWEVLEGLGEQGCPVAELICNHASFAQTIENLFTLSFLVGDDLSADKVLVRDQKVLLWFDEEFGTKARILHKKSKQQQGAAQAAEEQSQFVMTLTMSMWQDMCKMVNREACKMRHRQKVGDAGPSQPPKKSAGRKTM